jgi:hypothetical protein
VELKKGGDVITGWVEEEVRFAGRLDTTLIELVVAG